MTSSMWKVAEKRKCKVAFVESDRGKRRMPKFRCILQWYWLIRKQPENIANPDVPGDIFNEMFCDLHAAVATFSRSGIDNS